MSGTRRILVVADEPELRTYARRCIERWPDAPPPDVLEAADAAQALRLAREAAVDVVVSEIELPRLSGFGLLDALRAEPGLAHLPVLLMAGEPLESAERNRLERLPAVALLAKPFNARSLCAAIAALLREGPP